MVEQIQVNPPYDLVATLTSGAADPSTRTGTSHANSASVAQPNPKDRDTVTLSASAQASQLYLQGNSVTQIAALLGLPAATVDSDLNIKSTTSQSVQPITAQTPATQIGQADAGTAAHAVASPYTAPAVTEDEVS